MLRFVAVALALATLALGVPAAAAAPNPAQVGHPSVCYPRVAPPSPSPLLARLVRSVCETEASAEGNVSTGPLAEECDQLPAADDICDGLDAEARAQASGYGHAKACLEADLVDGVCLVTQQATGLP
jgi:hypothetical protein